MSATIHATAVIDPRAELAAGVEVGPYAVIGAGVTIGAGTTVGSGAQIQGPTRIGRENRIFAHTCIGFEPQDLKFGGEQTVLEIGDRNAIREFTTLHRGTAKGGGRTRIGSDNLFMAYSHVAHDCTVGDRTIFSNAATLAGHVEVGDDAVIGAFSAVHQFCRVGRHAYIGGFSVITKDALPFAKTVGQKPACFGLNRIGLERKDFAPDVLDKLEGALRLLVRSNLNTTQALAAIVERYEGEGEIDYLVDFVRASKRGTIKVKPGAGAGRRGSSD